MFGRPKKKRSFFEKLTGAVPADDFDDEFEFEEREQTARQPMYEDDEYEDDEPQQAAEPVPENIVEHGDGELAVDVVNEEEHIVIKAMIAGVKPSEVDVDITRDMVTIRAIREEEHEIAEQDYYHKELFWGSFSRNILLPEEIDVEEAEAVEKHGLLILKLPKLDKNKKTKLHVKSR